MRFCNNCAASLDGMRPSARTCSAACRRAASRSAADTLATRDAGAAALLLRERQALEALQSAATPEQRAAVDEELARIGEHVDRLFRPTPDAHFSPRQPAAASLPRKGHHA